MWNNFHFNIDKWYYFNSISIENEFFHTILDKPYKTLGNNRKRVQDSCLYIYNWPHMGSRLYGTHHILQFGNGFDLWQCIKGFMAHNGWFYSLESISVHSRRKTLTYWFVESILRVGFALVTWDLEPFKYFLRP